MEMGTTKKMGAKGFITRTPSHPILSRNANLAYRLVSTALKNKYGKDLSLPAYEEILSLEQPEEYADVKSKAPAEQ